MRPQLTRRELVLGDFMRLTAVTALLGGLLLAAAPAKAASIVIDFDLLPENISPGVINTGALGNVTFTNAVVLTEGSTLNEFEFPPYSGSNVVGNGQPGLGIDSVDLSGAIDPIGPPVLGGNMFIAFSQTLYSVFGYFTYNNPLLLTFQLADLTLVDVTSSFAQNLWSSTENPPNEKLGLISPVGIKSLTISFNGTNQLGAAGNIIEEFTLDDLTLNNDFPTNDVPVPEPATLLLLGSGVVAAARRRKRA